MHRLLRHPHEQHQWWAAGGCRWCCEPYLPLRWILAPMEKPLASSGNPQSNKINIKYHPWRTNRLCRWCLPVAFSSSSLLILSPPVADSRLLAVLTIIILVSIPLSCTPSSWLVGCLYCDAVSDCARQLWTMLMMMMMVVYTTFNYLLFLFFPSPVQFISYFLWILHLLFSLLSWLTRLTLFQLFVGLS